MNFSEIFTFFTDTIFRRDESRYRRAWVRWLVRQYKLFFYTARGLRSHGTLLRSTALTYYTLMSIVPILALIFAIVKGFGLIDRLVGNLYALFPQTPEIVDYVVDFAEKALARTQGSVVAIVGIVTLFWSVVKVFSSIERAFNNIWEVKISRSVTRQYTDYVAVVVVVPLLWVMGSSIGGYAEELLGMEESPAMEWLSRGCTLLVTWAMFTLLYIVVPNTKVRFVSALMAGAVAGVTFVLFQWGYVYLQRWMSSYNAIYGSFAALPLFLVWLQTSWQILLFGGELSFAYQNIDKFDEERESLLVSYDNRRKVMLAVMLVVVERFCSADGGAVTASEVRRTLNLPTRIVNNTLYALARAGLLIVVRGDDSETEDRFTPARDVAALTVYDVLEAVEQRSRSGLDTSSSRYLDRMCSVLEQVKDTARGSEGNMTLRSIADRMKR